MSNEVEESVFLAFIEGHEEAFNTLYNTYYKRVYFFIYKHCYHEEMARDIVQNTFISAYRGRASLREPRSFYAWILKIAYREFQKVLKKEKRNFGKSDFNIEMEQVMDSNQVELPMDVMEREALHIVLETIENMDMNLKDIAILRYMYELTLKEIAEVLTIPLGTVKSRMYRVNRLIQKKLKKQDITTSIYQSTVCIPMIVEVLLKKIPTMGNIPIAQLMQNEEIVKNPHWWEFLSKFLMFLLGTTTAVGCGVWYVVDVLQKPVTVVATSVNPTDTTAIEKPECKIISVDFDDTYTNQSVELQVTTTNTLYDTIAVNGENTVVVQSNGTYTVSILRDGFVLDEEEVEIKNIDKEVPELLDVKKEGEICYIYLQDSQSGLNIDTIRYYLNDEVSQNYTYDAEKNAVFFPFISYSYNTFYVEDYAGNWRRINIRSDLL